MPRKPTQRQKKAVEKLVENGGSVADALREAEYSPAIVKNPQKVTESQGFQTLMNQYGLDDASLAKKHTELLNSQRLDHMVFPLGPSEDDEEDLEEPPEEAEEADVPKEHRDVERTTLTDEQIREMLANVNCTVRRIVHGRTARHVYFWSPDNKARKDALDMAYKIKGHYAPEKKHLSGEFSLAALFDESLK